MARLQKQVNKEKLRKRYLRFSLLILLLTIVFVIWIGFLVSSVYFLGYGYSWAGLTMNQWIIAITGIIGFFIFIELLFIIHYQIIRRKTKPKIQPKQRFFQGKKIHRFTIPLNAKGGLFSTTYIIIDNRNIVKLRFQLTPAEKLWNAE